MFSSMFSKDSASSVSHHFRGHYARFKGISTHEHPMCMYSRFMGKSIISDYRHGRWHDHLCQPFHNMRSFNNELGINVRSRTVKRVQTHNRFCKVCISSTLTKPVDGYLHLACSGFHGRKAVCDCKPEIVVAVNINRYLDICIYLTYKFEHCRWNTNTYSIGDIYYIAMCRLNTFID